MARKVSVVPHTHWDREWYAPFPAFRQRLVELLDELLPRLDADPGYGRFLLDGQMAMVDDYLEVRPEAAAALRRLATAGRISVGPWYVLMDEFCTSGETIVRNLQLGMQRAAEFGGAMDVGYLPDMFGHVAQMPQLLAAAGMQHAVVWRGVPSAVARTAFWWQAPDGSTVRAEYLPAGYGNGAATPLDSGGLVRRLNAHQVELGALGPDASDPILWMNGTDHQAPQPWLARVVADTNAGQDDFELVISSLAEHVTTAPTDGLTTWAGELRSGARANILMGVLSNRVDVRAAAARAELAVERRAEPFSALWLPAPEWPSALLANAWLQLIHNSAHDSICACSADEVGLAVLHRFATATATADALSERALRSAAVAMAGAGPVVVNASHRSRGGVVELLVAGDTAPAGTQELDRVPEGSVERTGTGAGLARLLGQLTADGWLPPTGAPTDAAVEVTRAGVMLDLVADRLQARSAPEVGSPMAEAWALAGAGPDVALTVRVSRPASVRVAARVADVPGYGWAAWQPRPLDTEAVRGGDEHDRGAWLDNGLVHLAVDPTDGTFSIDGVGGLDRLVDGGDEGDTYSYSPPAADLEVDRPEEVSISLVERGPVRGRLGVRRRYQWPSQVCGGARAGATEVEVRTELELRTGEQLVRVTTSFDNHCRDHRLRTVFPLPERARSSVAECAFGIVTRGLTTEGGTHERGLPTFPSRRFVSAGGLTVTHEGLLEYEVVGDGGALALTLLRCTGFLSRPAPAYRPNAAGPALALEAPQMIGPVRVRYGLAVGDVDPYALADEAWLPLEVIDAPGGGTLAPSGSHLVVLGAEVSALYRSAGATELRVFNPSGETTRVDLAGRPGWLVDLRGLPLERFEGSFALRPWGIATARLDP